jgi:hypothetical protein
MPLNSRGQNTLSSALRRDRSAGHKQRRQGSAYSVLSAFFIKRTVESARRAYQRWCDKAGKNALSKRRDHLTKWRSSTLSIRSTQPVNRLAFSILMENTKGASQFRFDSEAASSASKLVYLGRSKISPREILERCPTSVVAGWLAARSHLSAQLRTDFAHVLAAYGYPAAGG